MFKNISFTHIFVFSVVFVFLLSSSFFYGVFVERERNVITQNNILQIIENQYTKKSEKKVPVFSFLPIQNGILEIQQYGESTAEARILINNNEKSLHVFSTDTKSIFIDVTEILPKIETVPAPSWAQFVGSKRGTTFWPLDHPRAFILSPKNRIFFATAEDAKKQKYKAGVK